MDHLATEGPDLSGYIVIRDDNNDEDEERNARRALNSAENQESEHVDVKRLVLGNNCCNKRTNCLLYTHLLDQATSIVKECRCRVLGLEKGPRREVMRELVKACVVKINPSNVLTMRYVLKCPVGEIVVCEKTFYTVYGITWHMMKTLREEVKKRVVGYERARRPNGRVDKDTLDRMEAIAIAYEFKFTRHQIAAAKIPCGILSIVAYTWMVKFFNMIGDIEPAKNEIHIDPVTKLELYNEYATDLVCNNRTQEVCSDTVFNDVWRLCLPYVKIRKYKACSGKCLICAILAALRQMFRDPATRQQICFMYMSHKTLYMGERLLYAQRIEEAVAHGNSTRVLSLVMDGMDQGHSRLPWFANTFTASEQLHQHLQGVTTHGKRSRVYRTFNNFKGGANLAIHTFLLALWEEYEERGELPATVYVEVDGGSENANTDMKTLCELLIVMDIGIKCLVMIRMPTGHNHADQDGKFGVIWLFTREKHILTPQAYKTAIHQALRNEPGGGVQVIDLHVLVDWSRFLEGCKDPHFGLSEKMEYTQHVWRYQKVPKSDEFPMGCRTDYRAYSADEVSAIVPAENELKYGVRQELIRWLPEAGFALSKFLPPADRLLYPAPFREFYRRDLTKTVDYVKGILKNTKDADTLWDDFDASMPQNDSVEDYVAQHPERFFIPFEQEFKTLHQRFHGMMGHSTEDRPPRQDSLASLKLPTVMTADSVRRSDNRDPAPPRVLVETGEDATANFRAMDGEGNAIKRRRFEGPSRKVGTTVFMPAKHWGDYGKKGKWPFTTPLELTFIRGIIDSWDAQAARFSISFDAVGEKGMICSNKWFATKQCVDVPPQNGHELTLDMANAQIELTEQLKKAKVLEINDIRYFCAAIWEKCYKNKFPGGFPYEGFQIENSYFRAHFRGMSGKKYKFEFDAFVNDDRPCVDYASATVFGGRCVSVLPTGGQIITAKMYGDVEAPFY